MNVNPIANAGIFNITNHVTNNIKNKGAGTAPDISPEALQNLESTMRDRIQNPFDTVEIGKDHGIKQLEELSYDPWAKAELSTVFTSSQVSEKAKDLSLLMDERPSSVGAQLGWTLDIDQAYRDRMVQHFGEIGRRLDEAFTAGEISQQEYDDLNAGLAKYTEVVTSRTERREASLAVLRKTAKMRDKLIAGGASQTELDAFNQWHRETLEDRIKEYIEKSCKVDRNLLAKMVQQVRGGEDLVETSVLRADEKECPVFYL